MPVEIRELIIKTNIVPTSAGQPGQPMAGADSQDLQQLKREIMQECTRLIQEQQKRNRAAR